MNTLFILGAGSSNNYDQGVSPVPDLEVPINRDFFVNAKKIIDYYNLSHMLGPIGGLDHFIRARLTSQLFMKKTVFYSFPFYKIPARAESFILI